MALAIAGAAGSLVLAGTAGAVPSPPGGLGVSPASPTKSHDVTVSWTDATPDLGETITGYVGGLNGAVGPVAPGAITLPDGAYTFSVRAVQSDGQLSDAVGIPIVVDNGAPAITFGFSTAPNSEPAGAAGLMITPNCTDALTLIASCTAAFPWTTDGVTATANAAATDAAGNNGTGSAVFQYDNTLPLVTDGLPTQPAPAALVATNPCSAGRRAWTPHPAPASISCSSGT